MRLFTALSVVLAFALPSSVFAAATQAQTSQAKVCKTDPVDRGYWAKVYDDAVLHGTSAVNRNNGDEANATMKIVNFAMTRACVSTPSTKHLVLQHELTVMAIDRAIPEIRAMLKKGEVDRAFDTIEQIKEHAVTNKVILPAQYHLLAYLAAQSMVDNYFAKLDEGWRSGRVDQDSFDSNEKHACGQIRQMPVPTPERCGKYR